jgi:hypothetical protein
MTTTVNTNIIQYIAIAGSISLLLFIIELVRRDRLHVEYSLLWLFFSGVLIVLSIWRDGLQYFSSLVGITYPPSAILLVLLIAVYFILIHYSIVISKLTENVKTLTQELGLLKSCKENDEIE